MAVYNTKKAVTYSLIAALVLGGCSTQQDTGRLFGAALLGGLCVAVVAATAQDACIAAAAAGFVVGGEIGRGMDERDRERREQAIAAALENEMLWQNRLGPQALSDEEISSEPLNLMPPRNPAAQTADNGWENPDSGNIEWINPDTQNSERIEPLRDFRVNGRECRQFRETYFVQGEDPFTEVNTSCRDAQGIWRAQ